MKRLALALALVACNQRETPPRRSAAETRAAKQACADAIARDPGAAHVDRLPEACVEVAERAGCRDALRAARVDGVAFTDLHGACVGDPEVAAMVLAFAQRPLPVAHAPAPAPGACPPIIVTLAADGASVGDGTAARVIAPCGASIDHTALALALCDTIDARTCRGELIIRAEFGTQHGDVMSLMQLAQAAGLTRLSIGDAATPPSDRTPVPARCDEPTPSRCP